MRGLTNPLTNQLTNHLIHPLLFHQVTKTHTASGRSLPHQISQNLTNLSIRLLCTSTQAPELAWELFLAIKEDDKRAASESVDVVKDLVRQMVTCYRDCGYNVSGKLEQVRPNLLK